MREETITSSKEKQRIRNIHGECKYAYEFLQRGMRGEFSFDDVPADLLMSIGGTQMHSVGLAMELLDIPAVNRDAKQWAREHIDEYFDFVFAHFLREPERFYSPGLFNQYIENLCAYINNHPATAPAKLLELAETEYDFGKSNIENLADHKNRHGMKLTWREDDDDPKPHAEYIMRTHVNHYIGNDGILRYTNGHRVCNAADRSVNLGQGNTGPAYWCFYSAKLTELLANGHITSERKAELEEEYKRPSPSRRKM